jgi:hypothetical protein
MEERVRNSQNSSTRILMNNTDLLRKNDRNNDILKSYLGRRQIKSSVFSPELRSSESHPHLLPNRSMKILKNNHSMSTNEIPLIK